MARGIVVAVNGLLTHDHHIRVFLGDHRLKQLGDRQRLWISIRLDENCAVSTHGQGRAQGFLRLDWTDGNGDDFRHDALFLLADSFFDCDFAERIHRHFDIGEVDAGLVGLDPRLDVIIDHPLYRDEHLHDLPCASKCIATNSTIGGITI